MAEPQSPAPAPETLLEFPCAFPIKIMGLAHDALAQTVLDVVLRHAPDYDGATMEMRASSAGKYVSVTCTINATSKAQLDALYRELSAHPMVKVVL
jgi:putative lipoic acid-binding regulatory protein